MSAARLSGRLARIREARSREANSREADVSEVRIRENRDSQTGSRTEPVDTKSIDETPSIKPTGESAAVVSRSVPGWSETAPLLFEREAKVEVAGYRAGMSVHIPLLFPREREALETNGRLDVSSLAFFDLETTGLSRGAGTVAFMAGISRFEKPGILNIHQLLISDFPGEGVFLERLSALLGDNPVLVSFNGKCFDSQVLLNRFLMNGIRPPFLAPGIIHLDLLFPSRRLWKNEMDSCRLSAIEEEILGINRIDDLPGSEAPDAWFSFLRAGDTDRLLAVGDHNRDDCFALARLLFALDDAIDAGTGRAALIRALALRRQGRYEEAALLISSLAESGDLTACRLLAVDCEHRLGDLDRALSLAEAIGDGHRAERIRLKQERRVLQ